MTVIAADASNLVFLDDPQEQVVDDPFARPNLPPQVRRLGFARMFVVWDHVDPEWRPNLEEMARRCNVRPGSGR